MEENKSLINPLGYQVMKGELLTLRAFLHFDLLRLFGHSNYANRVSELSNKLTIPYVTEFSKDVTPQSTYAAIFTSLKKDLNDAIKLLWGENGENCYRYISSTEAYDEETDKKWGDANGDSRYFFTYFDYENKPRIDYYVARGILARVLLWEGDPANYQTIQEIVQEYRKGYKIGSKVIRHSMVVVAN